ncbi:MAG TPA: LuxR C-terminal-related transcriptional regulator [Gemmatimonadaceae bacterium]
MTLPLESGSGPVRPLTARQVEVVRALARGLSYRGVGEELGMAESTVRAHVNAVAMLLPNPAELPAGSLVKLWGLTCLEMAHHG